jgi:hypothetical protein
MNFLAATKRRISLHPGAVLTPLVIYAFCAVCLAAQNVAAGNGTESPAPPTLEQRMQASLSRQVSSAAAMLKSVDVQRQAVQRQNGNGAGGDFFTLPGPARMIPVMQTVAIQPDSDDDTDTDNTEAPEDQASLAPDPKNDPGNDPGPAAAKSTIPKIADIGAIAAIADLIPRNTLNGSGIEGILLKQLSESSLLKPAAEKVPQGASKRESARSNSLLRNTSEIDYIRQILSFGTTGFSPESAALLQGLGGEQ